MSKRFYPQQPGDRKKAKLDISISDHNFPLSQNNELKDWGDDNDDEILLLASQVCEQACSSNDFSQLPDYSICMQPGSTSTQIHSSTSKTEFTFKKPSFNTPSAISTNLKEKCDRISSPLPGISSKITSRTTNGHTKFTDDVVIDDKVFKNQDADYIYKQLLQFQEENAKLKSENGKLLEKCVTKEGEASILRTQLKSSQIAVDNARLEKIKAQERVQVEWNEKLAIANNQMHDLRTQLDFKNLEIISIKEKCKKLESSKIKLTQVTVGPHDISLSHRNNNTIQNESITRRVKTCTNAVQTDNQLHFFKLNKICSVEHSPLTSILPFILEPSTTQQHSILDYNEKLQKTTDLSQNRCRIYSTFHRVPTTPVVREVRRNILISSVYEDVTSIADGSCDDIEERYSRILDLTKQVLCNTQVKLEELCQRVTTSFQKEMDERYMETSLKYLDVSKEDLLKGRALYKEEHDILARRMVAILSCILESSRGKQWFTKLESESNSAVLELVTSISSICTLLNNSSCATLYSGLLLSTSRLLKNLPNSVILMEIIKTVILSRPMTFVLSHILVLVTVLSENSLSSLCPGTNVGNLKTDYDQGVLLYKKDSCYIQILLKQMETCLKCIEKQNVVFQAVVTTQQLIILYYNVSDNSRLAREKSRCDCQLMLVQLIVYSLRVCANMIHKFSSADTSNELLSVCRCGIQVLYQCVVRDVEFSSQLSHNEGHLIEFCDAMRMEEHSEVYNNMLTEISGTLQSSPEEMPPSFHRQPWLKSFETFSLVD